MRLIDADAFDKMLVDAQAECKSNGGNFRFGVLSNVRENLRMMPTIEQERRWIPVSERLPEEKETIFAKLKGTDKWRSAMFEKMSDDVRVVVVFADGTRRVSHSHTIDGKWECEKHPLKRTVTHWMPNPKLPKESGEVG